MGHDAIVMDVDVHDRRVVLAAWRRAIGDPLAGQGRAILSGRSLGLGLRLRCLLSLKRRRGEGRGCAPVAPLLSGSLPAPGCVTPMRRVGSGSSGHGPALPAGSMVGRYPPNRLPRQNRGRLLKPLGAIICNRGRLPGGEVALKVAL
jgi:hypothetical protein